MVECLFNAAPATAAKPMVVAVEMGYGHLRAAHTLADAFGVDVVRMDRGPLAGAVETLLWKATLKSYAMLSKASQAPVVGIAGHWALGKITAIAATPKSGITEPANLFCRAADSLSGSFIGRKLRTVTATAGRPLLATYPAPAFAVQHLPGVRVFCLATDTDLNRAWAPVAADRCRITYFAPTSGVVDRLRSFGVRPERIHLTGFPLPPMLVREAPNAIAHRLRRLDPSSAFRNQPPAGFAPIDGQYCKSLDREPICLTVAIGGAGAQVTQACLIVQSLRKLVHEGKMEIKLMAGVRPHVARVLARQLTQASLGEYLGCGIEICLASSLSEYFRLFDACLASTDLLWTKPSELAFYAALGIPLLLAPPVGAQEVANRNWLLSHGAALDAGEPLSIAGRLERWLVDGDLCRAAWAGYSTLERNGLDRIVDITSNDSLSATY
jgi:hypothetical protein